MKTNPLKEGTLTAHSAGIGTVTRDMVRDRAVELAVINGRDPKDVSKADWDQARHELTGDPDTNSDNAVLESLPESDRWDPVPGSAGEKVAAAPSEDEDSEGRSDNQRLVEEGMEAADHDQMLKASKTPPAGST